MGNHISKRVSRQERLAKMQLKNERERAFIQTLIRRKHANQSWSELIDGLYHGILSQEKLVGDESIQLYKLFKKCSDKKRQAQREMFREVLLHLDQQKCHKLLQDANYLIGLFVLVRRSYAMIRSVREWKRSSYSVEKQFVSLVNHFFVRYETPRFLYQVWLDAKSRKEQQWFIDITSGKSIRRSRGLPIVMTKKTAHFFGQAEDTLTVAEALRWAQTRGMGGSVQIAQAVASSRLSRNNFRDESFWETVIRFLVQQSDEFATQVGEVVDYIANAREENSEFSMKGRTWNALWRQTEAWHEQLNRERKLGGRYVWEHSNIGERLIIRGSGTKTKTFQLIELCSSKALAMEGRKMRHCVSSYAYTCYKQRSTIFSLRMHEQTTAEETTLATIEVDLKQRRVVQAKARFNEPISQRAQQIMEKWASEEGLTLATWL
ncbi:MAG: PcfJ domain-containing protein [Bacteroidota bacterium]